MHNPPHCHPGAAQTRGVSCLRAWTTIYVVSLPERTRAIFNLVAEKLGAGAGVNLHAGKTRVCPPDMDELGPDVWETLQELKSWGTPIGTAEFKHEVLRCQIGGRGQIMVSNQVDP